jgi:hypothetical protein
MSGLHPELLLTVKFATGCADADRDLNKTRRPAIINITYLHDKLFTVYATVLNIIHLLQTVQ